jgi:hypothetical protein
MNINPEELRQMRRQIEEEAKKDLDALDRVAKLLDRSAAVRQPAIAVEHGSLTTQSDVVIDEPPLQEAAVISPKKPKARARGLWKACRNVLPDLPETFNKNHLLSGLAQTYPQIREAMSDASVRGILERFVIDGYVLRISVGKGNEVSIYQKIVQK